MSIASRREPEKFGERPALLLDFVRLEPPRQSFGGCSLGLTYLRSRSCSQFSTGFSAIEK